MELDVSAGEFPNSTVSDGVISLDVPGTLVAMVYLPNNTVVPVFTLGLVCYVGSCDHHMIHGNTTGYQNHCGGNPKPEKWF